MMDTNPDAERSHLERFADGRLPDWAQISTSRYEHAERVAELLADWADALELTSHDVRRWKAAGWLHDVLRDADPDTLRPEAEPPFDQLPGGFLHGPVAAQRLAAEGLHDQELLDAIRYHTLGRAGLGRLGQALMCADYLDPGRPTQPGWRASQRARMPAQLDDVAREVAAAKIRRTLERGDSLRPSFIAYWNSLVRPDDVAPI